jgi:hypothetical protein
MKELNVKINQATEKQEETELPALFREELHEQQEEMAGKGQQLCSGKH